MSIKVPSTNTVTLAGRLVRDPEIKHLTNSNAVANLTVVNSQYYRDNQGKTAERTAFIRVVCWGKLAEAITEKAHKGDPVIVEGRLETNQWEDQQGQKRSATQINAMRVDMLTWGDETRQGQGQGQEYRHDNPTGYAASQPPPRPQQEPTQPRQQQQQQDPELPF